MFDPINWNFSKRALGYYKADSIYVSFPKSGRTWIRVFIYAYFSFAKEREFSWDPSDFSEYPTVVFSHDRWEHRRSGSMWDFLRGKYLVPPSLRDKRKIILMCRDPRDVAISLYFQLSKRAPERGMPSLTLKDMLRSESFGIAQMVGIMNLWAKYWDGKSNVFLLRYEDCRKNAEPYFRETLEFLGIQNINEEAFQKALDYSSFEQMKKREAQGDSSSKALKAADKNDPESFKTRKGKVGGFVDYMDEDDLAYCNQVLKGLDSMYGYKISS